MLEAQQGTQRVQVKQQIFGRQQLPGKNMFTQQLQLFAVQVEYR
jgi:hypothetical protein